MKPTNAIEQEYDRVRYPQTITVLYRCCKKCEKAAGRRVAKRVTYPMRTELGFKDRFGYERKTRIVLKRDSTNPFEYRISERGGKNAFSTPCDICGKSMVGSPITGVVNEKVACDSRCTGAVGHNCECSCGGRNHGIDHSWR